MNCFQGPCCISVCQGISLAKVPAICLPEADPTNRLATAKAKAIKEKVAKPFPYMEVYEFLPTWANPAEIALRVRLVLLFVGVFEYAG